MAILVVTYDSSTGFFRTEKIGSAQLNDGAIVSGKIGSGGVGVTDLIADGIIASAKVTSALIADILAGVADGGVTSAKIASGAVGDGHIYPNAVRTAKILDANITSAKLTSAVVSLLGSVSDGGITSAKIASGIVGIPHLEPWASGKAIIGQGTGVTPITKDHMAAVAFVIDGGGEVITSGTQGKLEIPFPATIAHCRLLADQSGSIGIDLRKDTYAGYEGIVAADSICSGTRPILSSAMKYQDATLTGWNKKIASGDILAYIVDAGISNITRCTVSLGVYK